MKSIEGFLVGCPKCRNDGRHRYGYIGMGKQRLICLLCGRLFFPSVIRKQWKNKPDCPACGKRMYFYQQGKGYFRFRCSDYPSCKQYLKVKQEDPLLFQEEILKGRRIHPILLNVL